jgi:hypothetical protein
MNGGHPGTVESVYDGQEVALPVVRVEVEMQPLRVSDHRDVDDQLWSVLHLLVSAAQRRIFEVEELLEQLGVDLPLKGYRALCEVEIEGSEPVDAA